MFVYDLIIGMLVVSGISMAAVGLYARKFSGRVPAATPYILLMFAAAAWSLLYALDLVTTSLPLRIFYHNLRFLVLPFIPVLELWLVLAYVNKTSWMRKEYAALLLIVPVTAAILAITSPYHTLFRYNFSLDMTGPVPVLQYSESLFFEFYNIYSLVLLALALLLLVALSRKRGTLREIQTLLLIAALAFPTLFNYVFLFFQFPSPGLNPTPAILWIAAILYTIAIFRYQFLDIVPIARDRLVEALSRPVLVLDPAGRIIDLNPAACRLFSLRAATAMGRSIGEVVPDWPEFLALCQESTVQKRELARDLPDGSHVYIGTAEPLMSPGGEIDGRLVVLQDITDIKAAEAALRESERRYRDMFEINNAVMLLIDPETGRILEANAAACRYYGYTKEEFTGLEITKINVQTPDLTRKDMARAEHSPGTVFSFRHRKKDGEIRDVEVFSAPLQLAGRRILHSIIQDVTARRQAEEALRESEEKYRTIIEDMQDLFYRTDAAGTITMLSPSAVRLAGYDSLDQMIGKNVSAIYADPAGRNQLLAILQERGSVYAYPLDLKTRDGRIRHVTASSHFTKDAAGNITGVEGVLHDVTDQRQAEEALRMANRKLNLLASVTRHDIRNQLMALSAFIELSEEAIGNPEELAEFLKKNRKIAENILRQITFTKEYEDLGVKAPSWQDVHACIERARTELPLREIRVRNGVAGLEIFADPLVEKVFYNLIDNALRYGGAKMTTISSTSHPAGSSLVLVIEDDGEGIPDRDKKAIFDRGFGKNTGLGLFLSREILAITGITIAETGVHGQGARFEMVIPGGGFRFVSPDPASGPS